VKIVLQTGIKDCGICCLLSIIRFYGGEVSKEYLREITHTTKDGVSFYNLIEGAEKIGFTAQGLSGNLENIDVNNLPCIVHFIINKSYKHFVVLYQINKKKKQVILMDPAKGKKVISFSEFNLLSSGNYLFLSPTKKLPIIRKKNIIYKNILNIIHTNKQIIIPIIVLTITYFILNILTSFHFKYLLEYSINYHLSNNICLFSSIVFFLYFFKNINSFLKNILLAKWTSIFDFETTIITYKQVILLPYLYFKNRTTGEVISRFKDLNIIRAFLSNFFCSMSTDLISIIIFIITMFKINKNITYVVCILSLMNLVHTIFFDKKIKKTQIKISKQEDKINSHIIESISNVDTIKGSHLEKRLIDKFSYKYKALLEESYDFNKKIEISRFFKDFLNDVIYIFVYGLGSYYVIKNKLSLSSLIIYQLFSSYYFNCFHNILFVLTNINSYKISLERVEELFLINEENFKHNYFYLPYNLEGNIEIYKLNYKIGSRFLFQNLSLEIKRGEKILLSGASGCGKSTLVKMLLRYIETSFGTIKIANIDINHYHLENLRTNITYITNNEYLFTDTIRNNITLYKDVREEEFQKVCQLTLVDEIIKDDSAGYDKIIEENGFNFSNGERQRIILARSLLRQSSIYIFDEALAQIDINREKKILLNMFSYLSEKTIIIISHRFNNKKLFDRVLKLEQGTIHES